MGTRLYSVVVDCRDHAALGRWWARMLDWSIVYEDEHELALEPVGRPEADVALVFVPVPEEPTGKNRVHLDLASTTRADRDAIVERALQHGAHHADIGQTQVSWVVLADPEGNEFCVLAPDTRFDEPGTLAAIVMDAVEPGHLARFWADATGWQIRAESHLVATLCHPDGRPPALDLVAVAEPTPGKNRLHLDVAPAVDDDQHVQVERLERSGARPVDVGQGPDVSWVVLADPEGNEFCVLRPR